jgi:intracellular multiplication protein IcmT
MWRDTARTPKFFGLDARTLFPVFLFLLHMTYWTLAVAVVGVIFFWAIEKKGYTLFVLLRIVRVWIAGHRRPSRRHDPSKYQKRIHSKLKDWS